ncbi:MAG: DUF308 domain-containing protein [Lachnospiraceae bacterium]|nr:DUF308 domain-containing protein [Lachnospiraceae bacterium]
MKKIREFSRSYIFISFLYVAIGIVLLLWPSLSLEMIGKGLGIVLIVLGATYGVIYFTRDKRQEGFLQVELVIAVVCVALGVFILLTPEFLSMVLPFAMATVLLLGAIVKIQSTISMKKLLVRRWYIGLIAALVIIALGIVLLVYPFASDPQMLFYIGVCLILDGVTNLLGLLCIQLRTKKLNKMQKDHPGTDIAVLVRNEWDRSDAAKAEKKARKQEKKAQKNKEVVVDGEEVTSKREDVEESAPNGTMESGVAGSGEYTETRSDTVSDLNDMVVVPDGSDRESDIVEAESVQVSLPEESQIEVTAREAQL